MDHKRKADFILKKWKKGFSQNSQKTEKKEKRLVINIVELKKSPSYSYLHAAKFTE